MTREELVITYKEWKKRSEELLSQGLADTLENIEIYDSTIKALEQEPILDKIRAEIKEVQTYKMFEGEDTVYVERKDVLAIIDKYKAESEE